MKPGEAYEAITHVPKERLRELAELALEGAEVEVASAPRAALVMARVRETVDGEVFNLGEVLVTTCDVTLDGEPGWGMAMGHDPERALCVAVLDAASREGDADLEEDLETELAFVRESRRARWNFVQPTRVEFEEMA